MRSGTCWYDASRQSYKYKAPQRSVVVDDKYIDAIEPIICERL
jgi:hypothetical protein